MGNASQPAKELYDMVTEYVKHGYNRAVREKKYYISFLMTLMQRLVTTVPLQFAIV